MDVRNKNSANHPVMNLPPSLVADRFGRSPPASPLPGVPVGHGAPPMGPPQMGPPPSHGGPPPLMGPPGMMMDLGGPENLEQFGLRMIQTVTGGFLMLSLAMGHQTGLFQKLASFEGTPKTCQEIADEAGLKERYVREWLGAMVTGRIVNATDDGKFYLPAHRAVFLQTPGLGLELLILACALPMQSKVFDKVRACFDKDGPRGVPYDCYGEFHHFMNSLSVMFWEKDLFKTFVPSIPGLTEMLEAGASCLDVGCGEGGLSIMLGDRFPNSSFHGFDIIGHAIDDAKAAAEKKDVKNVTFDVLDAHELPDDWEGRFNYVVCWDSLHDMAKVDVVLNKIHKVLATDGIFSVLEINAHSDCTKNTHNPFASTYYTNSLFHCMTVSMSSKDGMGLGNMWGREQTTKTLEENGFKVVDVVCPEGWFNIHYLCKKK